MFTRTMVPFPFLYFMTHFTDSMLISSIGGMWSVEPKVRGSHFQGHRGR